MTLPRADQVTATLGLAAMAARRVLAHVQSEALSGTFAQLSGCLRALEEQRSTDAARTCAEQFRRVRSTVPGLADSEDLRAALDAALAALDALAAGRPVQTTSLVPDE